MDAPPEQLTSMLNDLQSGLQHDLAFPRIQFVQAADCKCSNSPLFFFLLVFQALSPHVGSNECECSFIIPETEGGGMISAHIIGRDDGPNCIRHEDHVISRGAACLQVR